MSLAVVYSRACVGVCARLVRVEVHLSPGLPAFSLVGLPETVVRESKERVRSAIITSNFRFPMQRITVNLAPADLPKQGGSFDLAIALGILVASKQLDPSLLDRYEFAGELALSGELRPVRGIIAWVSAAAAAGHCLVIPTDNASEADLILSSTPVRPALPVWAGEHLLAVCAHLVQKKTLPAVLGGRPPPVHPTQAPDLSSVRGQMSAKRALCIAAAGRHHLLFSGPPGSGKTLLARRLPSLLPPLTIEQAKEVAMIYAQHHSGFCPSRWRARPFRSPHHSASMPALVGGGRPPGPGEISLAHHGVLFLDELPEFSRIALESLREPLEEECITVSRAGAQVVYPARFQLIAAMNPCPCGFAGSGATACRCTPQAFTRYQNKLSGPLLDRIDIQIAVSPVPTASLLGSDSSCSTITSEQARAQVATARSQQAACKRDNTTLDLSYFSKNKRLSTSNKQLIDNIVSTAGLSARSLVRLLRVSQTIADIECSDCIRDEHIHEAFGYRVLPTSTL